MSDLAARKVVEVEITMTLDDGTKAVVVYIRDEKIKDLIATTTLLKDLRDSMDRK